MRRHRVHAVIVAVPARNEEQRIVAAIQSILSAAARLDPHINVQIVVAADCCTDGTVERLQPLSDLNATIHVVSGEWGSAGGARRAAAAAGIESVAIAGSATMQATWIATTDADSRVPVDWLTNQVRLAEAGYDAVAGIVELDDDGDRTEHLNELFDRNYLVGKDSHTHVHGANMGVRVSAYLSVGGFPEMQRSEDRSLWNSLIGTGFRVVSPVNLRVATSGRLVGRVSGGFADAMANIWI